MTAENKKRPVKKNPVKAKGGMVVKDNENDPFFIKKGEQSKAFLDKLGFPEELVRKK
jgi:hypothetical protein